MAKSADLTRRDLLRTTGAVAATAAATRVAGPAIRKAKAANNQVTYAVIGTGGRGQYLLNHLSKIDSGRCLAVCDIYEPNLKKGAAAIGNNPKMYADYRELLTRQDIDAVIIAVPLYEHFRITRDALLAGKHVFCEKSLVFKPEEVHQLRKLAGERPKQILQVGLQRRYSQFYQTAKQAIEKGMIGQVTHINAQWNRNPGWTMKPFPTRQREMNWRLFREYSGGLTAELASHQIDVADWIFGSQPEFVTGVGGLDLRKDGRDVYDNIQLIFKYPKGQKMMYQAISSNRHLNLFGGTRTEFGETILGTEGTIEITVGTDSEPAIAMWYYEPSPAQPTAADLKKEKAAVASATLTSTAAGRRGLPLMLSRDLVTGKESFLEREMKYARMWMYRKGVMVPQEDQNPVDTQMEGFFESVRTGKKPLADLEIGLADSTMVILANLAMDEGRRVYFNEIEKMGVEPKKG
ncbi:MAG: Gfo/Idh/MocA family protein [Rhodospirillales bacterium]